jgi:hypothetical protein
MSREDIFCQGIIPKPKRASDMIGDTIRLDSRTGCIHEDASESMATLFEGGPTPCRVLA